jgi:protein involved in polysaccharide export with SLBB domain
MTIMRRFTNWSVALLAIIVTSLAVPAMAQVSGPTAPIAPQSGAPTTVAPATVTASDLSYKLGSGDKVRVTVFGEPTLSGEFFVNGSGIVSLPLVGDVNALGLSVSAFQDAVQKALSDGYLKEPRVSAEVLTFRPFYILGEVTKPGTYPYTSGLTVLNAVATAGGYTYRANKTNVFIKHDGETEEVKTTLSPSTTVAPGDTIRIGERFF